MAVIRNAAIGIMRSTSAPNIAETIRRNSSQVRQLFASPGIFQK